MELKAVPFPFCATTNIRNERWDHNRIDWSTHVSQLEHKGLLANKYLMTRGSLENFVQILHPFLQRAEWNSSCLKHILIEHIVSIWLRVLSDGRTKDQHHITGTSLDATYKADLSLTSKFPRVMRNGIE
jgi:hypothetical protein